VDLLNQGNAKSLPIRKHIYFFGYGMAAAKYAHSTGTISDLQAHVEDLITSFSDDQKPSSVPEQEICCKVEPISQPTLLSASIDGDTAFGAGALEEKLEVLRAARKQQQQKDALHGRDPYAVLQPSDAPELCVGHRIERQMALLEGGDKGWIPFEVTAVRKHGTRLMYTLTRSEPAETVARMLQAGTFNCGAINSWRLDLDNSLYVVVFTPIELQKFKEAKMGTKRGTMMPAGSLAFLKQSGDSCIYYLARVGSVIDSGGTGKHRFEHTFSLLKPMEGVEIHAGEGFEYSECSYEGGDKLVVPCRALQTEAQRIGFSLVPIESMCLAERGQALVDALLQRIMECAFSEGI
jgi:hypothetical protein